MVRTNLYDTTEARKVTERRGIFSVVEYERDLSVSPDIAQTAYFASQMGTRKRQLVAEITRDTGVITQRGAMQLMLGDIDAVTDITGAGDLLKKVVGSKVTGESAIKPKYTGTGILVLEPTFRYIILEDLKDWDSDLVIEDGLFLACEDGVEIHVTARKTVSSAVLGKEGLFNSALSGVGVVALESPVPKNELIEINLSDDVVKIDGDQAIAWSKDLKFTVERTTHTLVGSMASGEGLVNVYRGSGRILVAPVYKNRGISVPKK